MSAKYGELKHYCLDTSHTNYINNTPHKFTKNYQFHNIKRKYKKTVHISYGIYYKQSKLCSTTGGNQFQTLCLHFTSDHIQECTAFLTSGRPFLCTGIHHSSTSDIKKLLPYTRQSNMIWDYETIWLLMCSDYTKPLLMACCIFSWSLPGNIMIMIMGYS